MNKHLGKIMVDDDAIPDNNLYGCETLIDRIKNIIIYFNEVNTPVKLGQISNLELLPNNKIYIKGCLFPPQLYNAYSEDYTIKKFIENGTCYDPTDKINEFSYLSDYYNYRFKEFSFSREEHEYSFILEPIE